MPFTPSHAVVALPFVRTPLVPAAIAIGAMTPDLPLFVRGTLWDYSFTHTFANVLWTSVLAFALFLLWRVVLRPGVRELSPARLARRLPPEWDEHGTAALKTAVGGGRSRVYPLLLAASLIIGVLSHITWDLFTHEGRWGLRLLPALESMWGPLPGYKWLQHGSSVVGLAIIVVWALVALLHRAAGTVTQTVPAGVRIAWWLSLPVVLITSWLLGLAAYGPLTAEFTVQHLAYRVLPPACAVWGVLSLVLCLSLPLFRRAHQRG